MLAVNLAMRRGDFVLDVAFQAPTPGIVALFGRSGAGKTSVVEILAGLLEPDSAQVRLGERILIDTRSGYALPAERRRIGYVFQDARLFPHLNVRGNLRYGLKRAPAEPHGISFDAVTELLGLAPLLARRPYTLSGGERQRVALGRALLSQPQLLLLDEPLASLDASRRAEVLPYFEALRDRLAIPMVYVSHHFEEVLRLADHVVLLDAGRVVAAGGIHPMSLRPELGAIVGPDSVGAVLEGVICEADAARGLARLNFGSGTLLVAATDARIGARARVQLFASDLILATHPAQGLSVRNSIAGVVQSIREDDNEGQLVKVDIGGASVLARVTRDALESLALQVGSPVWVLVKAVSMRSHAH